MQPRHRAMWRVIKPCGHADGADEKQQCRGQTQFETTRHVSADELPTEIVHPLASAALLWAETIFIRSPSLFKSRSFRRNESRHHPPLPRAASPTDNSPGQSESASAALGQRPRKLPSPVGAAEESRSPNFFPRPRCDFKTTRFSLVVNQAIQFRSCCLDGNAYFS